MPNLLFCIGKAVADVGLAELLAVSDGNPVAAAGLIAKIGMGAWKQWRTDKKQDKLHADIRDAAQLTFAEVKQQALDIARQVTPDPELQGHVERLVTLVPASIRKSLSRPEDLTGTTLPADYALADADDLVKLLPVRLPRFKAGDTPPFLRGWRLVEQVGAGGFGEVWKAQNVRAPNLVKAVKFGHAVTAQEQSILNEGDLLNRILGEGHNPGIVKLLDVWADGDPMPWLGYEYIAGGDLTAVIHAWHRLPAEERLAKVLDALAQLAATVGHFHALTPFIVHRDLKPSNILYDPLTKRFKVADFGIGGVSSRRKLTADGGHHPTGGTVLASYLRGSHTPLYASPQQKAGAKVLDPRDDVHAFGVIAFQMWTGRLDSGPGPNARKVLRKAGVPDEVAELFVNCASEEVDDRPKDAAELHARLQELMHPSAEVLDLEPEPPPTPRPVRPTRERGPNHPSEQANGPRSRVGRTGGSGVADPAAEYAAWKKQVDAQKAQAFAAAAAFDYPEAVRLMAAIDPPHLDRAALDDWTAKRDRLATVWGDVQANFKGMGEEELIGKLEEVVGLHPHHPQAKPWLAQFGTAEQRRRAKQARMKAGERFELALPGGVKMQFAWCPAGTFVMGSPTSEENHQNDEQQHEVRLTKGFYMGVHPVTQAEYQAVMGTNPSHFKGANLPVEYVSWEDAQEFCKKMRELTGKAVRLPTEAEWEYAARGGTTTPFYWGSELNGTQANCDGRTPYGTSTKGPHLEKTTPVGSYAKKFPHPWGLTDVHGNVWEWCVDCYDAGFYARSPKDDPECGDGEQKYRILRGGSWYYGSLVCRSANRDGNEPSSRNGSIGFRLCFSLDK